MKLIGYISNNSFNRNKYYILFLLLVSTVSPKVSAFSNGIDPPNYIINHLVLDEIGKGRFPVKNIEALNKKLKEYNVILKAQGKPLLYFGFTNSHKLVNVPFFQDRYNIQSASLKNVRDGYSNNTPESSEVTNMGAGFEELRKVYEDDYESKSDSLFVDGFLDVKEDAILMTKYYYGLVIEGTDVSIQTASIQWYSAVNYEISSTLEGKLVIDRVKLRAHYLSLRDLLPDGNLRLIETWYNYLLDKEIPNTDGMLTKSSNGKNIDKSIACKTLTNEEFVTKREKLVAVVNKEEVTASNVSEAVLYTCFDVISTVNYSILMKGIDILLLKDEFKIDGVDENLEVAILRLIHAISPDNYAQFFEALEQDNDALLNNLLAAIDDHSINPYDGENYTSLIQELLRIGNANNGEYLIKKRTYLLKVLFQSYDKKPGEEVVRAINEVSTFNLNPSEENDFSDYLTANEYKNLRKLLSTQYSNSHRGEQLATLGEKFGVFFKSRNDEAVYVYLLRIVFSSDPEVGNKFVNKQVNTYLGLNMLDKMFEHLPESSNEIYDHLVNTKHKELHNLLKALHLSINSRISSNYKATVASYYKGITELFSKYGNPKDRIELMKWGIENEGSNNDLESLFTNILKNIPNEAVGQALYDFLTLSEDETAMNYHYYKKIIENVLSGEDAVVEFTKGFMELVNTYGNIDDRLALIEYSFDDLLDTLIFWRSDKANLLSALFHDLSQKDADEMIKKLEKDQYALFRKIWKPLANDAKAEHFESFVVVFSSLFKYPGSIVVSERESYEKYLNEHQDYLNAAPSTMKQIEANYIPMMSSGVVNGTEGKNRYVLTSEIDYDWPGAAIVNIKVGIGHSEVSGLGFDPNSLVPEIILQKVLKPFETVIVEFIDDTDISDELSFKKGDIIGIPAFYLVWMDGEISSRKLETRLRVGVDAMVIVASGLAIAGSGGTALPIAISGGEIIFAVTDMSIALYEDELRGEFGDKAIDVLEILNIAFALGNLPGAIRTAPEGFMKLKLATGRMISPGVKAVSGKLSEIRLGFRYYRENLPAILKGFESADLAKLEQLSTRLGNAHTKFERVLSTIKNPTKATKNLYGLVKDVTIAVRYLRNAPKNLAFIIKNNPGKFEISITNDILELKQKGKIFCKIDPNGVLSEVQFKIIPEGETMVLSRAKFKDGSGNINEIPFQFKSNKNEEIAFWRLPNKMDGFLMKNKAIASLVENNPGKFEMNLANGGDLLELRQNGKLFCRIGPKGALSGMQYENLLPYYIVKRSKITTKVLDVNGNLIDKTIGIVTKRDRSFAFIKIAVNAIEKAPNSLDFSFLASINKGDKFWEATYNGYGVNNAKFFFESENDLKIFLAEATGPDCTINVIEKIVKENVLIRKGHIPIEEGRLSPEYSGIYVEDEVVNKSLTWTNIIDDVSEKSYMKYSSNPSGEPDWNLLFQNEDLLGFKLEMLKIRKPLVVATGRAYPELLSLEEEALIRYLSSRQYRNQISSNAFNNAFNSAVNSALKKIPSKDLYGTDLFFYKIDDLSVSEIAFYKIGARVSKTEIYIASETRASVETEMLTSSHSVLFVIKGKNGKLISATSVDKVANQAVFTSGSEFYVNNIYEASHPLAVESMNSGFTRTLNYKGKNEFTLTVVELYEIEKGGAIPTNLGKTSLYPPVNPKTLRPLNEPGGSTMAPVRQTTMPPAEQATMRPAGETTMPPPEQATMPPADDVLSSGENELLLPQQETPTDFDSNVDSQKTILPQSSKNDPTPN